MGSSRAEAQQARRRRVNVASGATVAVLLAIGLLVAVKASSGSSKNEAGKAAGALPESVMADLQSVTPQQLAESDREPVRAPHQINASPVTKDGKPYVLYVGAEYCPFCAAERWALTLALTKFGSFEGLKASYSGSSDVFPDTATVSYYGSTYTSDVLAFRGLELRTNELRNGEYTPLEKLEGQDLTLFSTFNAPPYVDGQGGSIPWVSLGGTFIHSGSSFSPEPLAGKSQAEIAAMIADARSPIGAQIRSAAANYVKVLCGLTKGAPAATCDPFSAPGS